MKLFAFLLFIVSIPLAQLPNYSPPGKLVDIGGYKLHLNCTGKDGPTVVLIAGAGDFSFDWELVQPDIARFTKVCSYDRAGLAWSDPGPTPRTMRQDAQELNLLLKAARVKAPYVLVGHSLGGLIARVYAEAFPSEVAGIVLVDPTHEDTVLGFQGKLVRMREFAKGRPVPPAQTLRTSPPKPPAKEDLEQFESNRKNFGPPKIGRPFDKLSASAQAMHIWARSQPPRAAASEDFWPEELQMIYTTRAKTPYQLGDRPLVILLPKAGYGSAPSGISEEEWKRFNEEKRQQKLDLVSLSHNSKVIVAENSGHHIQLDEPQVITEAIRLVVNSVRRQAQEPKRISEAELRALIKKSLSKDYKAADEANAKLSELTVRDLPILEVISKKGTPCERMKAAQAIVDLDKENKTLIPVLVELSTTGSESSSEEELLCRRGATFLLAFSSDGIRVLTDMLQHGKNLFIRRSAIFAFDELTETAKYPEGGLDAMKAAIPIIAESGKLNDQVMQNMSNEVLWQIVRQGNKDLSKIAKRFVSNDPR